MTELRVLNLKGIVDSDNSSSTPLGIDGVFTGSAIKVLDYGIVFVSVYSNVASAIDGLSIEQSVDGSNWDFTDVYTINAGSAKNFSINPHAQYLRVTYTNGGVAQSEFRLQTVLKGNSKPSSHRLKDDITNDDDAELQTSVLKVQTNDETTYKNVDVQNPLPVDGDQIYGKDLDLSRTVTTGWTGDVSNLFGNLTLGLQYTGATNPKALTVYFRRTIVTSAIGLGTEGGGNFSNDKIIGLLSGGSEVVLHDDSTDDTNKTSHTIQFIPLGLVGIRIEFHTADTVNLTNFVIIKLHANVSTLQAVNPDGIVVNIEATKSNNLKITDAESGLAISNGDVSGTSLVHKFGNAPDFDIADGKVTIWDGANDTVTWQNMQYTYSASADIDSISSSNSGDTVNIEVQGLDSNWDLVVQTKALTGQTRVALDTPLIRVFRMKNVGSSDLLGNVFCYVNGAITDGVPNTATDIRAVITNGNNQTLMCLYTVPNGKNAFLRSWHASTAGGIKTSANEVDVFARPFGQVFQLKHRSSIVSTGTSQVQHNYLDPPKYEPKTDLELRVNTDTNTVSISGGFDIVLKDI